MAFPSKLVGNPTAKNVGRLAVLLCDTPIGPVEAKYGTYQDIFATLFEKAVDSDPARDQALYIEAYDVVQGEYPTLETLKELNGVLLTGSAASAYENVEWIQQLIAFVASLPDSFPLLKIIGICFGHQIVSAAFGTPIIKNSLGWEIGVRSMELTPLGQRLLSTQGEMQMAIQQMHQDIASAVPATFYSLASTPVCPTQGFVRFRQDLSEDALQLLGPEDLVKAVQIFTLQGHPEFVEDIVDEIIGVREAKGVISTDFAEQSRIDAAKPTHQEVFGRIIVRILGL